MVKVTGPQKYSKEDTVGCSIFRMWMQRVTLRSRNVQGAYAHQSRTKSLTEWHISFPKVLDSGGESTGPQSSKVQESTLAGSDQLPYPSSWAAPHTLSCAGTNRNGHQSDQEAHVT